MSRPTPSKQKRSERDLIDQQTHEFLARGRKIQREEIGQTKAVDLTWRNYASAAFDDLDDAGEEE